MIRLALAELVFAGGFPCDVPVDPDRPEARQLLESELAKPEYQAAKPTWFDELAGNFVEWLLGLQPGQGQGGAPSSGLLVILLILLGLAVIAFLVFGLPRINRRSKVLGSLFGEDDARTAAHMRAAGREAASRGDYVAAIAEMFRSIARGLAERSVLTTSPGTTAHDFATRAAGAFPDSASELASAAAAFDEVRYLGRDGSAEQYDAIARLEQQLRAARPAHFEAIDA